MFVFCVKRLFLDVNKTAVLLLFVLLFNLIHLNGADYQFRKAMSSNRLSHSSVQCLAKDSAGFIWIGTKDGLNRYDGYQFLAYKYDPDNNNSISNNEISCLAVQGDSILWVGTRGGGINRLGLKDGRIQRFAHHNYNGFVSDISIDYHGVVWAATPIGLLKYDVQANDFTNVTKGAVFRTQTNDSYIPGEPATVVDNILAMGNDRLMVATGGGIFSFDTKTSVFHEISPDLRYLSITSNIVEDKGGNIWIANYDGLLKLSKESQGAFYHIDRYSSKLKNPFHIQSDRVDDATVDKNGKLWFVVEGVGLAMMDGDHIVYVNSDKVAGSSLINRFLYDDRGVLWVGFDDSGLYYVDLSINPFKKLNIATDPSFGSELKKVKTLAQRNNHLFIGTSTGGVESYKVVDDDIGLHKSFHLAFDNQNLNKVIKALWVDDQNDIWVGTSLNSIIQYCSDGRVKYYKTNGYVFSLFEDDRKHLWYGTWGGGFGYIDRSTGQQQVYSNTPQELLGLSNDVVLSIKTTSYGFLLVGTKGGGLNVAPIQGVMERKSTFKSFKHDPESEFSIAHNDIYQIIETNLGDIWLGTGRGLVKVIPAPGQTLQQSLESGQVRFAGITGDDGLPGGIVSSLCEDHNGRLWMATSQGLCCYTEKDSSIVEFVPEGRESDYCYEGSSLIFHASSHRVFYGGLNGVVYFNPDSVFHKGVAFPVVFTDFSILNQKIVTGEKYNGRVILPNTIAFTREIKLKHHEKIISFEFASLKRMPKDKVRYKYRLLGFSQDWIQVNDLERKITFTNLEAGHYTLQVMANNDDGSWPAEATEMDIVVSPPFWFTAWAYAGYALVLILLLLAFRKYSLIRLKEKNKLHILELEHRKEVEISEAKIRFFTNVSHEIRTPLTLIYEPLKQLTSLSDLPDSAKELSGMVMRNMKRLLNQVNRLLEMRKMNEGEYVLQYSKVPIEQLLTRIMYEFEVALKIKNIDVKYNIPCEKELYADRQLLDTIIYNLVSNAIKFLPKENGVIEFDVVTSEEDASVKEGDIRLSISDNGPGIPDDEVGRVFDYFYQTKGVEKSNVGGSGIGLAIVKEYVDYHGGEVSVVNLPQGGCRFSITLPMTPGSLNETSKEDGFDTEKIVPIISAPDDDSMDGSNGDALTMVIVEDDVDLAVYLKRIFKTQFKVVHYTDGQSALENIPEIMPDIVVTDLMMPNLNGMELTHKLKSDQETSHIPIVMLTAKSEDESKVQGLRHGADSYLVKPFSTEVLVAQVGAIVKSRQAFKERFSKNLVLEPKETVIVPAEEKFIKKILELTEARLDDSTFEVTDIVDQMGMSHSLLLRKFKAVTGMSLVEFIRSMRIKKAIQLFKQDKYTVAEVAYQVGFSDPKYFSKCFTNQVGVRPSEFIKEHHPSS